MAVEAHGAFQTYKMVEPWFCARHNRKMSPRFHLWHLDSLCRMLGVVLLYDGWDFLPFFLILLVFKIISYLIT